jgi:lipid-binding SYLF domain-containing protein
MPRAANRQRSGITLQWLTHTPVRLGRFILKEPIVKLRFLMSAVLFAVLATTAQAQRVRDVSETVELFRAIPQVAPYFASAYGYAIWPRIARGGLGVGGSRGRGQVYVNGNMVGFSTLIEVSVGLQAGGQTYRQVIFFENREAYEKFAGDKFEFDASAAAVAVTASAQAGAGTSGARASAGAGSPNTAAGGGYTKGMQVFTMAEGGLMYQATIAGQRYNFKASE